MQQIIFPYSINEHHLNGQRFENIDFGKKKIKIKLPNDIKIGSKLRLKGLAGNVDESFKGQDLILLLKKEVSNFSSINKDILLDLPINLNKFRKGKTKRINLADKKFDVKIPPISKYGGILKMKGLAEILNGGYPGDVLLRISEEPNINRGIFHMIFASFVGFDIPAEERKFKIKFKLPWIFEYSDEYIFRDNNSNLYGRY